MHMQEDVAAREVLDLAGSGIHVALGGIGVLCQVDCYLKGTGLILGVPRRPREGLG